MNHYETLGVNRSASDADIKQAFRRRASAVHPDRGGSDADMAAVNLAYEVLSDAERRARYDADGTSDEPMPMQEEAQAVLLSLFQQALSASEGHYLAAVRDKLTAAKSTGMAQIAQLDAQMKKLERRRAATSTKDGAQNLAHMVIDQQLGQMKSQRVGLDHGLLVLEEVGKQLDRHESSEQAPKHSAWNDIHPASVFNFSGI